jgi:hypothetical protein
MRGINDEIDAASLWRWPRAFTQIGVSGAYRSVAWPAALQNVRRSFSRFVQAVEVLDPGALAAVVGLKSLPHRCRLHSVSTSRAIVRHNHRPSTSPQTMRSLTLRFHIQPHGLRHLLAGLGMQLCGMTTEMRTRSQNLWHRQILTTITSYRVTAGRSSVRANAGTG